MNGRQQEQAAPWYEVIATACIHFVVIAVTADCTVPHMAALLWQRQSLLLVVCDGWYNFCQQPSLSVIAEQCFVAASDIVFCCFRLMIAAALAAGWLFLSVPLTIALFIVATDFLLPSVDCCSCCHHQLIALFQTFLALASAVTADCSVPDTVVASVSAAYGCCKLLLLLMLTPVALFCCHRCCCWGQLIVVLEIFFGCCSRCHC